jgi:hypothetical protein
METLKDAMAKLETVLQGMQLKFERQEVTEDIMAYALQVNPEEDEIVDALLYENEDGQYLRLVSYVDELDEDHALDQLTKLMTLNGEIPTGAYCLDPESGVVEITVNLDLGNVTAEALGDMLEFCFTARDFFYDEYYPEDADDVAKG